jgi:hypothetical protein
MSGRTLYCGITYNVLVVVSWRPLQNLPPNASATSLWIPAIGELIVNGLSKAKPAELVRGRCGKIVFGG